MADETPDTPDLIKGRIEAFEFLAEQFRTYADDNDEIHKRYCTKGKTALAVAAKRSETFRDSATDCDHYAAHWRAELYKLEHSDEPAAIRNHDDHHDTRGDAAAHD